MTRSGQITPLSRRIIPLDVWDHARIIEAEIRQARKASAGEVELDNALKTAERALGAVAHSTGERVRTLDDLRVELVEALATAPAKEDRLRAQVEKERCWNAELRDELTERDDAERAKADSPKTEEAPKPTRYRLIAICAGLAVFADLLVRVF